MTRRLKPASVILQKDQIELDELDTKMVGKAHKHLIKSGQNAFLVFSLRLLHEQNYFLKMNRE